MTMRFLINVNIYFNNHPEFKDGSLPCNSGVRTKIKRTNLSCGLVLHNVHLNISLKRLKCKKCYSVWYGGVPRIGTCLEVSISSLILENSLTKF